MATNSGVEWCHDTRNLWWGCEEVHEGCDNCYARVWDTRWDGNHWGKGTRRRAIESVWKGFAKSQRMALESKGIRRIFVGSMMDIFEKSIMLEGVTSVSDYFTTEHLRNKYFEEIVPKMPNLLHLMLTKRPSNINKYIPDFWKHIVPKNVMFGTSPVNQPTADNLIPHLLNVKGRRFLSVEPMLGAVDLSKLYGDMEHPLQGIDWVIVGGESGHGKRPFNPDWARAIRDVCAENDVAFFMKQWDKIKPIPEDLMIREFPEHVQAEMLS